MLCLSCIPERTKLVRKPRNGTVAEGSSFKLPCKASKDPNLELRYIWKKDGAVIMDVSNSEWQEKGFVLTLSNIGFQDAGVYTCVAHTPEPRVSEDMASAVVSIEGTAILTVFRCSFLCLSPSIGLPVGCL